MVYNEMEGGKDGETRGGGEERPFPSHWEGKTSVAHTGRREGSGGCFSISGGTGEEDPFPARGHGGGNEEDPFPPRGHARREGGGSLHPAGGWRV